MTRDEFNEWLPYHFGAFPDVETWLSRMAEQSQQNFLNRRAKQMADVPLFAMSQATDSMSVSQFDGYATKNLDHVEQLARGIVARQRDQESRRPTPDEPPEPTKPPSVTSEQLKDRWLRCAADGNDFARLYCVHNGWAKPDPEPKEIVECKK